MDMKPEQAIGPPAEEQPDPNGVRCYAVENLRAARDRIMELTQQMMLQRGQVEAYKTSDLAAARDAYAELQSTRAALGETLSDARFLLLEVEEYQKAATAGQLRAGLLRFDLMSTAYRPVYDTLRGFAGGFPVDGTTSAAIVGRLMNNIRMGYFPTDPDNISHILRGVRFPEGVTTNLLDPCCGCGKALRQIAQGNNCFTYGVELDRSRAEEAQTRLHHVGFGSFFFSRISREAFHLLFLNPPYLSVLNESGGRSRHEKKFLIESLYHLMHGGLLVYIIPYYRLTPDICCILCDNFEEVSVWRFTESEFKKFKQVAVLGIRKQRSGGPEDTLRLERYAEDPAAIPCLTELPEDRYPLPAQPLEVAMFKGEHFNQRELEQQLRQSGSFAQMMARSELDSGAKRPLLPLSISQIGLIGGSGMINGLIACDTPHIIKGRIVKVLRTESEEKFNYKGEHMGAEVTETISNKMIFNILTPKGFRALT